MTRVCLFFILICLGHSGFAQTLVDQLVSGDSEFSKVQLGLIGSGIDSQNQLEETVHEFEQFLQKIGLSEKQDKGSAARKIKALQRNLTKVLKEENAKATLMDAWGNGQYNSLTGSLFLELAAAKHSLAGQTWPKEPLPADAHFATASEQRAKAIIAAICLQTAVAKFEQGALASIPFLNASHYLDPDLSYQADRQSREWYNRVYKLYQAEAWVVGGQLAAAAAKRFPIRQEFQALCFNFGVVLSQQNDLPIAQRQQLMTALIPHCGSHQQSLRETMDGLIYNEAVQHYQNREFAQAWAIAKDLKHPAKPDNLKNLQAAILEGIIENKHGAGADYAQELASLRELQPKTADRLETRMKQMAVKTQFEDGDFESALKLVENQVDTPQGRKNYLAVLQRLINQQVSAKQFKTALGRLSKVPAEHVDSDTLTNMKYNTYLAWLNHTQDPASQFPIYKKMLNDGSLNLKEKERVSLRENWGNAYHLLIEGKIADRKFNQAMAINKEALANFPQHGPLQEQKQLLDTIMERIKE